jgi:hypothetical protein
VDVGRLAGQTDGMSGADLGRMVEDGKLLYAYDLARELPTKPITDYMVVAMETVQANRQRYARVEARAAKRSSSRPFHFFPPESEGDA